MKKRLVTLLLIFAVSLAIFTLTAVATTQNEPPAVCQHCQREVTWTKLTSADIRGMGPTTTGHYYLELDESLENYNWMATTKIPAGNEVCLYLNGEWIYSTTEGFTVQDGAVLNIMDDSGAGKITGRGRSTGMRRGGVLNIEKGGTVNLYGGELSYVRYSARHILDGGVAYVAGELNMHGGKITGGVAGRADTSAGNGGNVYIASGGVFNMKNGLVSGGQAIQYNSTGGNGGNVYVADGATFVMENGAIQSGTAMNGGGSIYVAPTASFEMKNGSITGGSADALGDCVLCRGTMTMSGNASIEELQLKSRTDKGGPGLSEMLTINGAYTGKVKLRLDSAVEGLDVGNGANADLAGAQISIYGSFLSVEAVDGQLMTVGAKSYCDHCQKQVSWTALTEDAADWTSLETGHYYLAFSGDSYKFTGKNIYLDQVVCLNLNGKQLEATTRAFSVFPGGTLSIMGDGTVLGHGGEGAKFCGGTIFVSADGELNLYSGTISHEDIADDSLSVLNGGTLSIEGTLNMYGGEVTGGTATNAAGTIFGESTSTLNFCGGSVTSGTAKAAPCIYNKGRVILSGNASVAQVLLKVTSDAGAPGLANMVTVSGAYTGTTVLRSVSAGSDIGTNDSADLSNANLSIYNKSTLGVVTWGSDLIVTDGSKAMSMDESGTLTSYKTAQAAVTACEGTANKVILFADVDSLEVTGDVTLDLNGFDVASAQIKSGVLYCLDSATDDYDVSDDVYGKVVAYEGSLKAVEVSQSSDGYLAIAEAEGTSFHRVNLKIKSMSLRPSDAGLYFISDFAGDHVVKERVKSFGVAMNTVEEPATENMATTTRCTSYSQEKFNTGAENTSSLVYNIMRSDLDSSENGQRADIQIYGRAYIRLDDNSYLFGATQTRSLQEQMELIDTQWDSLTAKQKSGLYSLHGNYAQAMADWSIPNLVGAKTLEEQYAKVEKSATAEDIAKLDSLYAGTTAYHGELHDHSLSGPKGDGKQTLEVWKKYMDIIGMDFATLVDHRQAAHMYLDEWDDTMFIGGSEFATWITDYTHTVDAEGTLQNGVHYNMTFADREAFVEFMKKIPEFDYSGEDPLTEIVPTYPKYTRARMTEIANTILDNGGFFTHVHPKSNMVSDNPLDYWFADWTGIEVIFTSRTGARNADNYKLWTDLLALGKKVYATAGSDLHNLPNEETMSTFYTTEKTAQAFVDNLRAGNFTAGMAGIRMSIGDTVMGSQAQENFSGKRLVFSVGDFHSSLVNGHDYRVDLLTDEGIVFSQAISSEETTYFAVEAQNCKFYRVEVYDTTDNVLISMGQPIWNAGA